MAESISTKTGVDFKALDHDARAAALVGTYLKHFALMEYQIDDTIAKILKLTDAQQFLLSPNITFHSKINVLGCLLDLSDLAKENKDKYAKVMGQMRGYSGERNVIAHSVFFKSDTSNGVEFITADARGKLKFPEYDWSIAKFEEAIQNLDRSCNYMVELVQAVTSLDTSPSALSGIRAALTSDMGLGSPLPPIV
jgi:hypothetical protein